MREKEDCLCSIEKINKEQSLGRQIEQKGKDRETASDQTMPETTKALLNAIDQDIIVEARQKAKRALAYRLIVR